ncbi:radical SAM protein [Streptomyces sp. NPDC045431]|uniref:B12-binding domain-containing radical SAM protein n=1 Tax=Streptomyces sp. NPDC045431 TaxID=3155613 RepID=UPI0033CCBE3D
MSSSTDTPPGEQAVPSVHLVFPPMVETNFGSIYPASAVLAGYLKEQGLAAGQEDLNEAFAEFLLSPDVIAPLGRGAVAGVSRDSLCAAAARWAESNRALLIDERGCHHFGADSTYGWVMEILAQPFAVNPDTAVFNASDYPREAAFYQDFYAWSGIAEKIPREVGLVGITVAMGPQMYPALVLVELLKSVRPDLRIVLGGATLSLMQPSDLEDFIRANPGVDCVVRFDGEYPLAELARQVCDGVWRPQAVPGVSTMTADGDVVHVDPGVGPNLNTLPRPEYARSALARLATPTLSITQARGCYWGKCDYCDFVELYGGSQPFRGRHPDKFTDEVQWLAEEFGVRRFNFVTESIPPAFARRMSEEFIRRGLDVTWNSFAMVDRRFDRELLRSMVESGCEFLVIGLETMVTRVLKLVRKSADREENVRFLRDARDVGMRLKVNLIPDLPSTTYEEALAALRDMEDLADCVDSVSVFPFEATRSSNVGREPERFGLVPLTRTDVVGQSQYALNHLHNTDPAMTREQREEVYQRYREFARAVSTRTKTSEFAAADIARPGELVRMPVEQLDLLDLGDKLVCTHMGTRNRLTLPRAASRLLAPHLTGQPFNVPERTAVSAGLTPDAARRFAELGMLVPAGGGKGAAGD